MYRLLDTPRPSDCLGGWQAVVGPFTHVVGWTSFGDLFLRDPGDGHYAVLGVTRPRLVRLRFTDRESVEGVYLRREQIIERLLRRPDVQGLEGRLGKLGPEEVFVPSGAASDDGSDDLDTYQKCDVWAFAARMAAEHGIGMGAAVDSLLPRLRPGDDFGLWRVAVGHVLSELPERLSGTLVQIGRCSHWLRPHQTRWKADGGFAWPTGYGSGQGGHSRTALPQFDWSVTLAWTGQRWEPARDKRGRPAVRLTLPSRTSWHEQAAAHTVWMTGREKEMRFYGFRRKDGVWRCTAESEWREDRAPIRRVGRRGTAWAG